MISKIQFPPDIQQQLDEIIMRKKSKEYKKNKHTLNAREFVDKINFIEKNNLWVKDDKKSNSVDYRHKFIENNTNYEFRKSYWIEPIKLTEWHCRKSNLDFCNELCNIYKLKRAITFVDRIHECNQAYVYLTKEERHYGKNDRVVDEYSVQNY